MLIAALSLVLAQRVIQLPPETAEPISAPAAVAALTSNEATWEQRARALRALEKGEVLSGEALEKLHKAMATASHRSSGTCEVPPQVGCAEQIGPCLSPAGFILAAVAQNDVSDPFVADVLRLLDAGSDPSAVFSALRVLAKAKHPRVEIEARKLLADPEFGCAGAGARLLLGLPELSSETQRELDAVLQHRERDSVDVAALLSVRHESWAQERALQLLHHPNTRVRLAVARSFAAQLRRKPEYEGLLVHVAQCDASAWVREQTLLALKPQGVSVLSGTCPSPQWAAKGRVVTGPQLRVEMNPFVRPSRDSCLGMLGGDCILGVSFGEWGGSLLRRKRDGTRTEIAHDSFLNPVAMLTKHNRALVLSSLEHIDGSGAVDRLRLMGDGVIAYEHWLSFNALPVAWAAAGERVFVAFEPNGMLAACRNSKVETTLVFEANGSWSLVRGASTDCLWPPESPSVAAPLLGRDDASAPPRAEFDAGR